MYRNKTSQIRKIGPRAHASATCTARSKKGQAHGTGDQASPLIW